MTYASDTFNGDGSTTEFTLTFDYIQRDHVNVSRIDKTTKVVTTLSVVTSGQPTGDQYIWETDTKIKVGTAPVATDDLLIVRDTPENAQIIVWKDGSYIVAEDLNTSDKQWLYNIQELEDQIDLIDGAIVGSAVKQVTGTSPVQVDNTDIQRPVVSVDAITKAEAQADPTNPAWDNDDKLASVGAIDCIYKQIVGDGTSYPVYGGKGKLGQIRIDNTGATPKLFYWDANAATPAWVEIQVDGPPGPPGPVTPVDVDPNTVTGPPGSDAAVENTGTNTNATFKFTIPRGDQGIQGPPGPDGPPGAGVDYKGPIDPTQPNSEPSNPSNGDFYVSTASGATTWTGLTNVLDGTRLIWNAGANKWDAFTPVGNTDLAWIAAPDKGTIFNSVGTDATAPLVDGTNAGLMSPGQKGELDTALQPGDNISELNNDSGFITASEVPATGVTSVNGDTGPAVVLDAADVGALPDTTSLNFVPLGSWASIPALT